MSHAGAGGQKETKKFPVQFKRKSCVLNVVADAVECCKLARSQAVKQDEGPVADSLQSALSLLHMP